jgi:hypothetical protein
MLQIFMKQQPSKIILHNAACCLQHYSIGVSCCSPEHNGTNTSKAAVLHCVDEASQRNSIRPMDGSCWCYYKDFQKTTSANMPASSTAALVCGAVLILTAAAFINAAVLHSVSEALWKNSNTQCIAAAGGMQMTSPRQLPCYRCS